MEFVSIKWLCIASLAALHARLCIAGLGYRVVARTISIVSLAERLPLAQRKWMSFLSSQHITRVWRLHHSLKCG